MFPLHRLAVGVLVTTGAGSTVTTIGYVAVEHAPVVLEVATTLYVTVPLDVLLLVNSWAIVVGVPDDALEPVTLPETLGVAHANVLLGPVFVNEMLVVFPLHRPAVVAVVITGVGSTSPLLATVWATAVPLEATVTFSKLNVTTLAPPLVPRPAFKRTYTVWGCPVMIPLAYA
jgi:hypothetical protein